jgi:hypothetical protein
LRDLHAVMPTTSNDCLVDSAGCADTSKAR